MLLAVYLWQSRVTVMVDDLLSGRDILSALLVGGLALAAGAALILGLAARGYLIARGAVARLSRRLALRRHGVRHSG